MRIKKMNRKSILAIVATLIFCVLFLLDYICEANQLIYRNWLALSILYYRYVFLITVFIILPCYLIKKKRSVLLSILILPIIAFTAILFFIDMAFNPDLHTYEYYTQKNGQKVIAFVKPDSMHHKTVYYYIPDNIFFMKHSNIPSEIR